ncbi:MAG: NADAR family protein [Dechloromonas sp.]|jgi:predicted NAD-dependent protein-ADP-ribosyltransferase YbiA (DUF1768 family)|nr:NADAR family protein [Dechloromonas sp.]
MNSNYITFSHPEMSMGGLSNLSPDFPVAINGVRVPTAEHLFHILRYRSSMIQSAILSKESAVSARRLASSKELIDESSQVWIDHKLEIMEFCVRTKLVWNWVRFGNLLRSTEDQMIYMVSTTDKFWGVKECDDGLVGENHYGKLLMRIRDELLSDDNEALRIVIPSPELDLVFLGQPVQTKDRRGHLRQVGTRTSDMVNALRP